MNSQEVVDDILKSVQKWSTGNNKLVIAIDGIPGIGKTTILDLMIGKVDGLLVHMDDFLTSKESRAELLEKGFPDKEVLDGLFDYSEIRELVKQYKEGRKEGLKILAYISGKRQLEKIYDLIRPVLIIEGTFMFHDGYFKDLWDKRIYLDGDEEKIKERRIVRTKEMMGVDYISEDDPKSFFNRGIKIYHAYQNEFHPKQKADLVLEVI